MITKFRNASNEEANTQIGKSHRINISKALLKKKVGLFPFLIPLLTAVSTAALLGTAAWGTKKMFDKISETGVLQNWEERGHSKNIREDEMEGRNR